MSKLYLASLAASYAFGFALAETKPFLAVQHIIAKAAEFVAGVVNVL